MVAIGSNKNTINLQVSFVKHSEAMGAFIILFPAFSQVNDVRMLIIPCEQSFTLLTNVPFGLYRVYAYDIDRKGNLMMPIARPALVRLVVVSGSPTFPLNIESYDPIDIAAEVDASHRLLRVNCTYDSELTADSFMVILRSSKYPDILRVKLLQIEISKSLVYSVEEDTKYTITIFTINNESILNSSISSIDVYVGMLKIILCYSMFSTFPQDNDEHRYIHAAGINMHYVDNITSQHKLDVYTVVSGDLILCAL